VSHLQRNYQLISMLNVERETANILKWFALVSSIDRGSGREAAMADKIVTIAKNLNLNWKRDEVNNVVVYKPATPGYESSPSICFQAHIDMVAIGQDGEDFDTSTIRFVAKQGRLYADNTTLGADNGIGVAFMLSIMEGGMPHGPLEFLFTTDEENGLTGAKFVDSAWVNSQFIINLDSENWGEVTIGCAGGGRINTAIPIDSHSLIGVSDPSTKFSIELSNLLGGHSGDDINKGHANAIIELAVISLNLLQDFPSLRLLSFDGGSRSNVIPSQCMATFIVYDDEPDLLFRIKLSVGANQDSLRARFKAETKLTLTISELEKAMVGTCFSQEFAWDLLRILHRIPNGVLAVNTDDPSMVQTSNNIGVVETKADQIAITTLHRSSSNGDLLKTKEEILRILSDYPSVEVAIGNEYSAWEPQYGSKLLEYIQNSFAGFTGSEIKAIVIHGGLECAHFISKWPTAELVSIGPNIKQIHSQNEYVELDGISPFWRWLLKLMAEINQLK